MLVYKGNKVELPQTTTVNNNVFQVWIDLQQHQTDHLLNELAMIVRLSNNADARPCPAV